MRSKSRPKRLSAISLHGGSSIEESLIHHYHRIGKYWRIDIELRSCSDQCRKLAFTGALAHEWASASVAGYEKWDMTPAEMRLSNKISEVIESEAGVLIGKTAPDGLRLWMKKRWPRARDIISGEPQIRTAACPLPHRRKSGGTGNSSR
jgi:hypothetical protein